MTQTAMESESTPSPPCPLVDLIRKYYPDDVDQLHPPHQKRRKTASPSHVPSAAQEEAPADPCAEIMEGPPETDELTPTEKRLANSNALLEAHDFDQAVTEATAVLSCVPPLPVIAGAAYVRGKALLAMAAREMVRTGKESPQHIFDSASSAFELSAKLNPDCEETQGEIEKLSLFLKALSEMKSKSDEGMVAAPDYEVIIVGWVESEFLSTLADLTYSLLHKYRAGCSGVGVALMLTETFGLDKDQVLMIERGPEVGHSFRQWPKEMRFISPSFNQQGWSDSFDLNSSERPGYFVNACRVIFSGANSHYWYSIIRNLASLLFALRTSLGC